jgi:small subunit ribosomal protein S8
MYSLNQLFSSLQNGQRARKSLITIPKSKICVELLNILLVEGLILGYGPSHNLNKKNQQNRLFVYLKYKNGEALIKQIRQISSSGNRVYFKSRKIQELPSFSFVILSTSKGLMTCQKAANLGIGGEPFCQIF